MVTRKVVLAISFGGFVQSAGTALGSAISAQTLKSAVCEEAGHWRERLYGPLTTLVLFIEQVLGADHSCCQDAVARGLSARGTMGWRVKVVWDCQLNAPARAKATANAVACWLRGY